MEVVLYAHILLLPPNLLPNQETYQISHVVWLKLWTCVVEA